MIALYLGIVVVSAYLISEGMRHLFNAHYNRMLLKDAEAQRRHELAMGAYEEDDEEDDEDDDEDEE